MSGHRDRTRRGVALLLAFGLVLGACRSDRKLTEPDPVPVTEKNLQATLLTEDDLPSGFTAKEGAGTPIGTEILKEHSCDDGLEQLKPKLAASTDFTGNGVTLTDTTAWFPGQGRAAEQVYRDLNEKCRQVVVGDAGLNIRTLDLQFGVLSDNTYAIQIELEPRTGPILERDLIVMRQGDLLHVIRLTGPRPSDKLLLDAAVRATIGRLSLLADDVT
ncbi:MAG: hypothetical protein ACT4OV_05390 [Microthrixaceae bacterium]